MEQFSLALSNPEGGVALGGVAQATFHLIDDESSNAPAGAKDVSFNIGAGANGPVNVLSLLPSGKLLVGGDFDVFNGTPEPKLIRLRSNGSLIERSERVQVRMLLCEMCFSWTVDSCWR